MEILIILMVCPGVHVSYLVGANKLNALVCFMDIEPISLLSPFYSAGVANSFFFTSFLIKCDL